MESSRNIFKGGIKFLKNVDPCSWVFKKMFGQVGQTGPLFGYFKDFYYFKDYFLFIQILELQ